MIIETVAGSLGSGPASEVAQTPNALALDGTTLYVSDGLWCVIRAVDLRTGEERVVAGNGGRGFGGDDGPAVRARLANPVDVATGPFGALLIVDYANQRIRRVDRDGIITTVAGTGAAGFNGDNQPAVRARLDTPNGVTAAGSGDLFIADTNNQRVRRVDRAGIISTVAGTGVAGYAGDGGPAIEAQLRGPSGVSVNDGGDLYIADSGNHCIRRVDRRGVITTVAGIGAPGFGGDGGPAIAASLNSPFAVHADPAGNVHIPDFGNDRIRRVGPDGVITTVAGSGVRGFAGDGGPAVAARLRGPTEVVAASDGTLYLADLGNKRVRRVTTAGLIGTVAGNGTDGFSGDGGRPTACQLLFPSDVCTRDRVTYLADCRNNRIRRIDRRGVITTIAGTGTPGFSGDGEQAFRCRLDRPTGIAADEAGNVYLTDRGNNRVRRITPDGLITTIAGTGPPGTPGVPGPPGPPSTPGLPGLPSSPGSPGPVGGPGTPTSAGPGPRNTSGGLGPPGRPRPAPTSSPALSGPTRAAALAPVPEATGGDTGPALLAALNQPTGIAVSSATAIAVADTLNHRIRQITADGTIRTVAGDGTAGFGGDGGPAATARLNTPTGLAVSPTGELHLADTLNHRVRRVTAAGTMVTVAGTGTPGFAGDGGPATAGLLNLPTGLTFDESGALYIADSGNRRLRRVAPDGTLSTVAGTGDPDFGGDGGPADTSRLRLADSPADLAGLHCDPRGLIYLTDTRNQRVRRLRPAPDNAPDVGRPRR